MEKRSNVDCLELCVKNPTRTMLIEIDPIVVTTH